jgi:hypothetical protein
MSDDANPKAEDPKAELEDRLVKRSMEPYEKVLDDDEKEGMRLFLDVFVKTHPVMRRMVDRRVKEEATIKAAKRAASAPPAPPAAPVAESGVERRSVEASGVVSKERDEGGELRGVEASGVVSKDGANDVKDKAGGEP